MSVKPSHGADHDGALERLTAMCRIAGPDDPIYQGGLVVTGFNRPKTGISTADQKAIVERMRADPKYKQA
jgi:hypothetical protein